MLKMSKGPFHKFIRDFKKIITQETRHLVYILHTTKGQLFSFQFFISFLKLFREFSFFMFSGMISQNVGPKKAGPL